MNDMHLRCDNWTHAELVQLAAHWLRHTYKAALVLTERGHHEVCDVVGWKGLWDGLPLCIVVECKRSRSDFKADLGKPFRSPRRAAFALGDERWYFAPVGIVPPDCLPPGWGLVEYDGHVCRVKVKPRRFELHSTALSSQILLLARELRIFQAQGISYKPIEKRPSPAALRAAQDERSVDEREARQLMRLEP